MAGTTYPTEFGIDESRAFLRENKKQWSAYDRDRGAWESADFWGRGNAPVAPETPLYEGDWRDDAAVQAFAHDPLFGKAMSKTGFGAYAGDTGPGSEQTNIWNKASYTAFAQAVENQKRLEKGARKIEDEYRTSTGEIISGARDR